MQGRSLNLSRILVRPVARASGVWTVACNGEMHGRYFDREDALAAAHALGRQLSTDDIGVAYV